MEITAGLRCPSYGASFDSGYQKAKYADIAGYVSGAQVLFIPHATAYLDSGLLHKMNSVTISGGRVTQNSTMKTTASANGIALTRFREAYGRYSRQVSEVVWACSSATVQTSPR